MSTHATLSLTEGSVSASIAPGAYMDAAVAPNDDGIAGFEIAVDGAHVTAGPREDFRSPLTLTVSCDRATMLELGCLLLDKGGAPAFNEREWRIIADALRYSVSGGEYVQPDRTIEMAKQIEEAYSRAA
jgi:hypothetical protein